MSKYETVDYDELLVGDYLDDPKLPSGEVVAKEHFGMWIRTATGTRVYIPRRRYGKWNRKQM